MLEIKELKKIESVHKRQHLEWSPMAMADKKSSIFVVSVLRSWQANLEIGVFVFFHIQKMITITFRLKSPKDSNFFFSSCSFCECMCVFFYSSNIDLLECL
jgi:hypothetical protein